MRHSTTLIKFMLVGLCAGSATAQDDSRLAEIAARQEQKASEATADQQSRVERAMLRFRDHGWSQRFLSGADGFAPKFGGLAPGMGFALGMRYKRSDLLGGRLMFLTSASSSLQGDRKLDVELTSAKLAKGKAFATLYAVRHDYSRMQYYGPGPDSEKTGRTNFRLEDTAVDGTFGVRPVKGLTLAASAGYLFNNIGPGSDRRFAPAELTYTPRQTAGIDVQSNFLRTGAFAQYDWRDNPDGARRGGNYFVQFSDFRDRTFGLSDFRRIDFEAQQYVPVLNERRVFALRARSSLTYADRPIPFYMQPSLGGGDDLRGYRPFRFRGDNMMVMNAEYRWEIFSGLDMALFADAGKVFDKRSQFSLKNLESNVGFGFRLNERNRTFLRLDVGFSHEGFQVWVKFGNIFKKGPVLTSSNMGDF